MRTLLITPPLLSTNSPYPATPYLKGYLKTIRRDTAQFDASLELLLRLFTRAGLLRIRAGILKMQREGYSPSWSVTAFLENFDQFHDTVGTAVSVLQEKDPGSLPRAARHGYFPSSLNPLSGLQLQYVAFDALKRYVPKLNRGAEVSPLLADDPLQLLFGAASYADRARHLASCMLLDLVSVIQETLDPNFAADRHAESVALKAASFEDIHKRLLAPPTLIDEIMDEIAHDLLSRFQPDVVAYTVPFPGNFLGALRMAGAMKSRKPQLRVVLGGGFINTNLRECADRELFRYADYITLDDGFAPLRCLLEHLEGKRPQTELLRTLVVKEDGAVHLESSHQERDVDVSDWGIPSYEGLPLDSYLCDMGSHLRFNHVNGSRWNKLTLAHGCYWRKCAFCDTSLDYVSRYEPVPVGVTMERIISTMDATGNSAFHFVDEAAPPAVLRSLATELIAKCCAISWRANIRFEKVFCKMARLLARSGCVAVSGGIEAATDRVLKLMNKGIGLRQIARVCHALSSAGILVHGYLIFGFPTQTDQETVNALEFVRQLFAADALHSCTWHQFVLTQFSHVASHPDRYGIQRCECGTARFCAYAAAYKEENGYNHDEFAAGLHTAACNFMAGLGLDRDPRDWFQPLVMPPTSLPADFVRQAVAGHPPQSE